MFLFATVVLESEYQLWLLIKLVLINAVWTLVMLYKNWRSTRHPGGVGVELSLPIRVMAFGLYVILAMRWGFHDCVMVSSSLTLIIV